LVWFSFSFSAVFSRLDGAEDHHAERGRRRLLRDDSHAAVRRVLRLPQDARLQGRFGRSHHWRQGHTRAHQTQSPLAHR
jgi:hypothetical protein